MRTPAALLPLPACGLPEGDSETLTGAQTNGFEFRVFLGIPLRLIDRVFRCVLINLVPDRFRNVDIEGVSHIDAVDHHIR